MDDFKFEIEGEKMVISINGIINTANAGVFEREFFTQVKGQEITSAIIDAKNLKYLSSAGLRSIFCIKDTIDDLKIINVSSDVYAIFDATGFVELMDIKKAD